MNNEEKVLTHAGFDVDDIIKNTIRNRILAANDNLQEAVHLCIVNYSVSDEKWEKIQAEISEHQKAIWSIWQKLSK